jgi:hypothetical protein
MKFMENWLTELLNCKYSAFLEEFYDSCSSSPKHFVTSLIDSIQCSIGMFANYAVALHSKYSLSNCRILYEMLQSESERLRKKEFTKWLMDTAFHKALFAVCSEIVYFIIKRKTWLYSSLYSSTGISAFELSIMIENVIKYETQLRPFLVHHLKQLEESLINHQVWHEEFPFYSSAKLLTESHLQSPSEDWLM